MVLVGDLGRAAQPDDVEPEDAVEIAHQHVGGHVGAGGAVALHERPRADPGELVDDGVGGQDGAALDLTVPAHRGAVDQDDVVGDDGVVPGVRVGHPVRAVAHDGRVALARGAGYRHRLAEDVAVADPEEALRVGRELQVLRLSPQHGAGVHEVALADRRVAPDRRVGPQDRARADPHVRLDDAERADLHVVGQRRRRVHDCRRVNPGHPRAPWPTGPPPGWPHYSDSVPPLQPQRRAGTPNPPAGALSPLPAARVGAIMRFGQPRPMRTRPGRRQLFRQTASLGFRRPVPARHTR